MKGLMLTEFLDFVETEYGAEVLPALARGSKTASGRYHAMETYEANELFRLVEEVGTLRHATASTVLRAFGERLFDRFATLYPVFVTGVDSAFEFLDSVQTRIHKELGLVHSGAEFPTIEAAAVGYDGLDLTYRSQRHLADLADGLIRGCITHFGEAIDVTRENINYGAVRFHLLRRRES